MELSIQTIRILKEIVTKYGPPTESNIIVYRGLMQDFLVDYTRELNILKIPLEQGLVLRLIRESNQVPIEILLQQMVTYLHANFGMDKNAAKWAIEGWAEALRITSAPTNIADFSYEPERGIVPLQVHFFNRSKGSLSHFEWDFGDGINSTEENPVHVFEKPGKYVVRFLISDGGKSIQSVKESTIRVYPDGFSADYTCEIITGTAPLITYFFPKYSSPHATYHWSFGDGNESNEEKPSHEYCKEGKYSVRLRITQDGFTDEKTLNDLISVTSIPVPEPAIIILPSKPDKLSKDPAGKTDKFSNIKVDGIKGVDSKKIGIVLVSIAIILIVFTILWGGLLSPSFSVENEKELLQPIIQPPTPTQIEKIKDTVQEKISPHITEHLPNYQPTSSFQNKVILIHLNGKSPYQWGEEIQISGRNTAGNTTYLFFEKMNGKYAGSGYNLENPPDVVNPVFPESYTIVPVSSKDNSWKYSWNTSSDELERLVCSVYALNSPVPLSDVSKSIHAKTNAIIIGAKPTPAPDMSVDGSTSDSDSF